MNLYILTLRKYLADNRRKLLLRLGGLAALSVILGYFLAATHTNDSNDVCIALSMAFTVYACIIASTVFATMKSSRGRIATLMTPATAWDKFAARWTVAVPLTLIALFAAFWLADASRMVIFPLLDPSARPTWVSLADAHNLGQILYMMIGFPIAIQAFFIFGAIAWPKNSALKSVLILWGWGILSIVLCISMMQFVDASKIGFDPSEHDAFVSFVAFNTFWTLLFWSLTYLRLRESNVVDRFL